MSGGYSIHAGTVVGAQNREGLERLCRYVLRPPLAKSRLEEGDDGNLMLHLSRTWSDGTATLVFSPLELVEKLASLIPAPRTNQILYTGVFAPAASWRDKVVPVPVERESPGPLTKGTAGPCPGKHGVYYCPERGPGELLWRVFAVNGFACPLCSERMKVRPEGGPDVVIWPPATTRILDSLGPAFRSAMHGAR